MKIEKIEKYRKGNFVFTYKHLYAQKKLKHIRKLITSKFNLVGGGREPVVAQLSKIEGFIKDDTVEEIIKNITNKMKDEDLLVESDQLVFKELMDADKALVKEFENYESLDSQNYDGLENPNKVREELLNIQKSLFNLQVKIIFSKLKKITKVDITPLLGVINNKINKMNNYIEKQEEIFTGESAPTVPQDKSSGSERKSTSTKPEASESERKSSTLNPKASESERESTSRKLEASESERKSTSIKPPAQTNSDDGKINTKGITEDDLSGLIEEFKTRNSISIYDLTSNTTALSESAINDLENTLGDKLFAKANEQMILRDKVLSPKTLATFEDIVEKLLLI